MNNLRRSFSILAITVLFSSLLTSINAQDVSSNKLEPVQGRYERPPIEHEVTSQLPPGNLDDNSYYVAADSMTTTIIKRMVKVSLMSAVRAACRLPQFRPDDERGGASTSIPIEFEFLEGILRLVCRIPGLREALPPATCTDITGLQKTKKHQEDTIPSPESFPSKHASTDSFDSLELGLENAAGEEVRISAETLTEAYKTAEESKYSDESLTDSSDVDEVVETLTQSTQELTNRESPRIKSPDDFVRKYIPKTPPANLEDLMKRTICRLAVLFKEVVEDAMALFSKSRIKDPVVDHGTHATNTTFQEIAVTLQNVLRMYLFNGAKGTKERISMNKPPEMSQPDPEVTVEEYRNVVESAETPKNVLASGYFDLLEDMAVIEALAKSESENPPSKAITLDSRKYERKVR